MIKLLVRCLLLFGFLISGSGCASFGQKIKSFLGGGRPAVKQKKNSNAQKAGRIDKKRYRKMTRKVLEDEAALGEGSGSLWVARGQGAYLFAQNTNRLIGDLINVVIEGHPKEQIETKVSVIDQLLEKIKAQRAERKLARARKKGKNRKKSAVPKKSPPKSKGKSEFSVKLVPTRIVEILKDGSYRVQGDQPFMIGPKEYKLVVSGIIRQDDFDDQGVSAETLLDPKFDILTAKKKGT